MDISRLFIFNGNLNVGDLIPFFNKFEGHNISVLFVGGLDFDFQKMEILTLGLDKIIHKFNIEDYLLVRTGKNGIFAEINPIFVSLQTLLGGSHNKGMSWWVLLILFVFLIDHFKVRYYTDYLNFSNILKTSIKLIFWHLFLIFYVLELLFKCLFILFLLEEPGVDQEPDNFFIVEFFLEFTHKKLDFIVLFFEGFYAVSELS